MKSTLSSLEKKWILYDVGNSAFILLVSTIMPIFFNYLASNASIDKPIYLAYWGYGASASTIIVALLGPILGAASDIKGFKKPIFTITLLVGVIFCIILGFMKSWFFFIGLFIIARSSYALSLIIYDSMLPDITTKDRMDKISSYGYGYGYIGSCIPFILCVILLFSYKKIHISLYTAMAVAFLLVAIWWIVMTLPLLKSYKQKEYQEKNSHPIKSTFFRLSKLLGEIKSNKKLLLFIISFFFYIDGVYTIIDMATAYGIALGLSNKTLLLALLLTQIIAFPASLFFGQLSQKYNTALLISICIFAYMMIALYAITLQYHYQFWMLAIAVGLFQGAIQSLSRSYFAKIIPADKSGEYFGFYDICGKGASFIGTMMVATVSQLTKNINLGVGSMAIMFLLGLICFYSSLKIKENKYILNPKTLL